MKTAEYYIKTLGLTRHIEGGSYKETYRSEFLIPKQVLPAEFKDSRNASTAIYFLLEHGQFSAFHRIASDEMWHFYDGQTLSVYEITKEGELFHHRLGKNIEHGERFQCVIKAGSWFGSRCEVSQGFSLVGCTVAPGFDFSDFELAKRNELISQFPKFEKLITEMTYE